MFSTCALTYTHKKVHLRWTLVIPLLMLADDRKDVLLLFAACRCGEFFLLFARFVCVYCDVVNVCAICEFRVYGNTQNLWERDDDVICVRNT